LIDYTALVALLPSPSSQLAEVKRFLQRLAPRVEAAQKRETAEMLDKLKGLGNSILGLYGYTVQKLPFDVFAVTRKLWFVNG
jgi:hypothetical protein